MAQSAWETTTEQWLEWIDADANAEHPVWVSCDEFDEDLRTMLERFPFLGGLDTTSVSIIPGPLPGERQPDAGFDSMTTLIRPTPLHDGEDDVDDEATLESPIDAAETMVRGRLAERDDELEVGIAAPPSGPPHPTGSPSLEIDLEAARGGEVEGLYIPALTRSQAQAPARTGDTLPPVTGGAPPPRPPIDESAYVGAPTTSSGTVVQPSPYRATDGGTVIAAAAPSGAEVIAYARQHGYAQQGQVGGQQYVPQAMYSPEAAYPSGDPHPPEPGHAPGRTHVSEGPPHDSGYERADARHPAVESGAPQDTPAESPLAHDDVTPIPVGGPPPPPPFGESASQSFAESTMDTPPAIDLASARAQAYDDDEVENDDLPSERSAASSQTAGEIVTGFDAADALPDDALEDVLDDDESPVPRKIVVADNSGSTALSEEELDTVDIIDTDTPPPRPHVSAEPPVPQEPPARKEAKAPPAPKSPPPAGPRGGPPPAPKPVRKSEPGRSETASALAQLEVEREGGSAALFERAAKEAGPATGAWYEDAFGDHYASLTRIGHPGEAKAEVEFFVQSTGLQPGATVLDIGCGDGAHALVLAQRGYAVTGFDSSLPQLLRATQANEALGAGVRFLHGDMRDPPVEGPFDGVLCLGTTLGYFEDEDNRKVIRKLHERLSSGGRAMIQVFNRDHVVARLPARSWWQGHGCLVLDEAEMNYFTNRLQVHRTVVFEDGRQFEHHISVRAYTAHDIGSLCVEAGMRVLELSGSRLTRGRFYGATSPEIWLLVERP